MKIITHSGAFHTDEVMATAMLKCLFDIESITRTRNKETLTDGINDEDTIVIDVGHVYDHERKSYDHHQETFNDTFSENYQIPLSSCGLIWKHYGEQLINKYLSELFDDIDERIDTSNLTNVYYKKHVQCIDANDNGIKQIKNIDDIQYNFYSETKLFNIVSGCNSEDTRNNEGQMKRFEQAVELCKTIFENSIKRMLNSTVNYYKYVDVFKEAYDHAMDNDLEYLYLSTQFNSNSYLNSFDPDKKNKVYNY